MSELHVVVEMKILSITVIVNQGACDKISLSVDLPSPFPSRGYESCFEMDAQAGLGIDYVKTHFPQHEILVIDAKQGKTHRVQKAS